MVLLKNSRVVRRRGFTLVEVLTALLIVSIMITLAIGAFIRARNNAWRERARETARQLATAWNLRLVDDGRFPDPATAPFDTSVTPPAAATADPNSLTFATTALNMAFVSETNYCGNLQYHVYFEQTKAQRRAAYEAGGQDLGLRDHWNGYFFVRLDVANGGSGNYDGVIKNPRPAAYRPPNETDDIHASVVVWSCCGSPNDPSKWAVAYQ